MMSQGEEMTFQYGTFFAQRIKKRLRIPTTEEWVFSKYRLTVRPAGQVLILSILTSASQLLILC